MKRDRYLHNERGAGLMEALLAIAIVGAILPFAYNGVMEMAGGIADAAESKRISEWADPVMAYVRKNQADWPPVAEIDFDEEEVGIIGSGEPAAKTEASSVAKAATDKPAAKEKAAANRLMRPYAGFIDKRAVKGGAMINAYLAFRPEDISGIRVANIARNIGHDAAIVAPDGVAVSVAGWNISSDLFSPGDLIFRISDILNEDETQRYLHRTYLDDSGMNTMFRDLNMAKHEVFNVGAITAKNFKANSGNIWFAETPEMRALEAYFPEGATIDPSKAALASVRVSGDISGFRKITVEKLAGVTGGTIWSQKGDMVADNVNVSGPVHVQRDLVLKSESSRTMSGFAGIRAHSLATPYVSADRLFFASGFGMTISSELMYSTAMTPIKLGGWSFPSASGPRFSTIVLRKISSDDLSAALDVPDIAEFAPIVQADWKSK